MANWPKELENAATAEQVIAIINDYLGSLSPEMWSWIPPRCTPSAKLADAQDIHHWHGAVSDECHSPSAMFNARLQEYAVILMSASRRLDQLDSLKGRSGSLDRSVSEEKS